MYRTANLQSFILYICSTNIGTEYFKHSIYSPFFPLQNAVCFIILTYLVPVLLTFYIQDVLKLNNSGAKRLKLFGGLLQVGRSCSELYYKSISRVIYLQLLPELSMNGDTPPLLQVFMVCTRTASPFYCLQ